MKRLIACLLCMLFALSPLALCAPLTPQEYVQLRGFEITCEEGGSPGYDTCVYDQVEGYPAIGFSRSDDYYTVIAIDLLGMRQLFYDLMTAYDWDVSVCNVSDTDLYDIAYGVTQDLDQVAVNYTNRDDYLAAVRELFYFNVAGASLPDGENTLDLSRMTLDELNALKSDVNAAIIAASADVVDGYTLLSSYSEYARQPDAHTGEMIRFDGKVVQVVEGVERSIYRIAVNSDTDCMFYVTFSPGAESGRILKDDKVTVCGQFMGLYTYTSTLGGEITIPYCAAHSITDQIADVGEYAATRQDPAPIGATVRYDGSSYSNPAVTDLTVTKVIRGDSAWQVVKGFNRYNTEPDSNHEYVVVYVRTAAISSENDQQAELDDYDFRFVSAAGMVYNRKSVSGITPEMTNLYPGAEFEAVVVGLVEKDDAPLMVYLKDSDAPIWFDLSRRVPIELGDDVVLTPLRKGDQSDDVKNMQVALVDMGYLSGTPDGDFGAKTEAAVKAYQEAMGLEATGIADEATLRLILTCTMPD